MKEEISIDKRAAQALREFIKSSEESEKEPVLRIQIRGGGCAGFQYHLSLDFPKDGDLIFKSLGETIITDPESFEFIKGSEITYTDGLNGAGFDVINPRAKSACGCGSSFTLDDQGCDQLVY